MTIVRCFEMLIPARFRERVRIWWAGTFLGPVRSYLDVREDLVARSELLFQTLEQRVIRNEQQLKEQLRTEVDACRNELRRLENRLAELEQKRPTTAGGDGPRAAS